MCQAHFYTGMGHIYLFRNYSHVIPDTDRQDGVRAGRSPTWQSRDFMQSIVHTHLLEACCFKQMRGEIVSPWRHATPRRLENGSSQPAPPGTFRQDRCAVWAGVTPVSSFTLFLLPGHQAWQSGPRSAIA